jgi:enhancer of polycomb-like protein
MSSRKVRVKKLSVKTTLPVLREDQIDPSEYEALTTENQIATGVEQAEENVSVFPPSEQPDITCLFT